MQPNHKKFISFEGIEGVGKSTNIQYVAQLMRDSGQDVVLTREPGGTPLAESLRAILLHPTSDETIYPDTELLLLYAGRVQHIHTVIYPALAQGKWVLCDRFIDATFAYQGGGRTIPYERIEHLNQWALEGFIPAHTFLFDAPPEVGFTRIQKRGQQLDRIEQEKMDFFSRTRAAYLTRVKQDPNRFTLIDAQNPLEVIQSQLKAVVENLMAL